MAINQTILKNSGGKMSEPFEVIEPEKKRKLTDIQKVILAWKAIIGVPQENKGWDRVWFRRYAKVAKDLVDAYGLDKAIKLMEVTHDHMVELGRTHTLDTVLKLADTYMDKVD